MTSSYDSTGVIYDKYVDIIAWCIADTVEKFGASTDTSEEEWIGHTLRIMSTLVANSNEVQQAVYDALSIANSTGTQLDNLVALIGLLRRQATHSTATLKLTSDRATTVPIGTMYGTESGVNFMTTVEQVFTGAGWANVASRCTVAGAIAAEAGEIDQIVNSVAGIISVTNPSDATVGKSRETDQELKEAHTIATATAGKSDLGSIFEALRLVDNVSAVYANENKENYTVDGLPGQRIHFSLIGGTDEDIATAIYYNRTSSIKSYGAQSVTIYDEELARQNTEYFDRASQVPLFVTINLTKIDGLWPDDGQDQIRTNLVAHFASFRIGQDVIHDALYGSAFGVSGVMAATIKIGTSASPTSETDLEMTYLQKAVLTAALAVTNVVISVS
jgi:uncharacterized phage protein gp47/JayE